MVKVKKFGSLSLTGKCSRSHKAVHSQRTEIDTQARECPSSRFSVLNTVMEETKEGKIEENDKDEQFLNDPNETGENKEMVHDEPKAAKKQNSSKIL